MFRTLALSTIRAGVVIALAFAAAILASGLTGASANGGAGTVYTLSNAAGGNQVAVFDRSNDGTLTPAGLVDTGGLGTGAGLGSQGAVVLDGGRLLAVNAGSDSISLFSVHGGSLTLEDVEPSGGDNPISVTVNGNIAYVLNGGAPENITGFKVRNHDLIPISGSTRPLSGSGVGAAQVEFNPRGNRYPVVRQQQHFPRYP